jgi:predicted KAP-like P-loop ATPase
MWPDKESDKDYLNFGEVSSLTVDILTAPDMLPVSVGIFGNWGAGKSSLLRLIEREIENQEKKYMVINFDAWLYQGYDDARVSLLEVIARKLDTTAKDNEPLLQKTKNLLSRVNAFRAIGLLAEGVALAHGVPTGGLIYKGVGSIEKVLGSFQGKDSISKKDFQDLQKTAKEGMETFNGLIKKVPPTTPPQQIDAFRKEYGEILKEIGKPLIVIIDNLDRCLPANAIHTLEAIRLFLFLPNTAFIIAADEEMIREAVADYFKGASDRHQIDYIDKLIQVPIRVPRTGIREIRSYLFMLFASASDIQKDMLEKLRSKLEESLQKSWQEAPIEKEAVLALIGKSEDADFIKKFELADRIAPILATSPFIQGNPRIVKRLLNVVKMRKKVADRRGISLDESIITKLVIFERCAGADATADLYRLIDAEAGKPKIFDLIEDDSSNVLSGDGLPESWTKNKTTSAFIKKWSQLEPSLNNVDLRAAVYLSRETMPIGAYIVGLSPQGREILTTLISISNLSSPAAQGALKQLALEEQVLVMEGIVNYLRQIPDWANQPKGFAGAVLLARHSDVGAEILRRFINQLPSQHPWMRAMIKEENWYRKET